MKKTHILFLLSLLAWSTVGAKDIKIDKYRYAGPFKVSTPLMIDSIGVNSEKFDITSLLDTSLQIDLADNGRDFSASSPLSSGSSTAIHLLQFSLENSVFAKADLKLEGLKHYRLFVDGTAIDGNKVSFQPGSHSVVVKCLTEADSTEHISMTVSTDDNSTLSLSDGNSQLYNINKVMEGERIYKASLSNSGRYLITTRYEIMHGGKSQWKYLLTDLQTGRLVNETTEAIEWVDGEDKYYFTRQGLNGKELVVCDVQSGKQDVLCQNLPDNQFHLLPLTTGKLILVETKEGPKDDANVHEYIHPDDRQPNWRTRYGLSIFDMKTGLSQPLTFGHRNVYVADISQDGRNLLASVSFSVLGKRPTERTSMMMIDLQTMQTKNIVDNDGFVVDACLSPDGKRVLLKGSPEAFGGIGKNLPEGRIPSMYDYQLFVLNTADLSVVPITKYFNPSINNFNWNNSDGNIYFTAEDRDCVNLFRCRPDKNYKIEKITVPEEIVSKISFAHSAPKAVIVGESASNSDRLYSLNLKTNRTELIEDLSAKRLKGITLGECKAWDFVNSKGDTICGRYYLPPHFDKNKKYPLIVYYYGGCSPTPRNFETRYPHHTYAAQGYVVYVLQPSGCAGFGQEFASRHVNTAGNGPAQDIIEGTRRFVDEHDFIDGKHIGCMGASYGGFMTQYLQTQTDMFAAAISHAGISDHTSYWGEGYWGYTYSEVSMAESYPWTRKDLYVDQSPLYNADKIHTPLLFLHGTADTNVPIGESIQMYTALKLLGRPTAFVVVEGENHGINDYEKRMKWQQTIYAWFARWLKEDKSWWDAMYPEKAL